jgi:hypothetical protein
MRRLAWSRDYAVWRGGAEPAISDRMAPTAAEQHPHVGTGGSGSSVSMLRHGRKNAKRRGSLSDVCRTDRVVSAGAAAGLRRAARAVVRLRKRPVGLNRVLLKLWRFYAWDESGRCGVRCENDTGVVHR